MGGEPQKSEEPGGPTHGKRADGWRAGRVGPKGTSRTSRGLPLKHRRCAEIMGTRWRCLGFSTREVKPKRTGNAVEHVRHSRPPQPCAPSMMMTDSSFPASGSPSLRSKISGTKRVSSPGSLPDVQLRLHDPGSQMSNDSSRGASSDFRHPFPPLGVAFVELRSGHLAA